MEDTNWNTVDGTDVERSSGLPAEEGVYEWMVPSRIVPGMRVIFVARLRRRGGCGDDFLSPQFDHWTGWAAAIPAGVQWRSTEVEMPRGGPSYVAVRPEGVEPDPCPFCGRIPRFEACETGGSSGVVICGVPHRYDAWRLVCCQWAQSPRMRNPIDLVEARRTALLAHAPSRSPRATKSRRG